MVQKIEIVNAALTRAGEQRVSNLSGNTPSHIVTEGNYEVLVSGLLAGRRNRWALTDTTLGPKLAGTLIDEWDYAYQMPPGLVRAVYVHVDGLPVAYAIKSDKVLCDVDSDVDELAIHYVWRVPEEQWPGDFIEAVTLKLSAIYLQAAERWDEANMLDRRGEAALLRADALDSGTQTPRKFERTRRRNGLADVRRGRS